MFLSLRDKSRAFNEDNEWEKFSTLLSSLMHLADQKFNSIADLVLMYSKKNIQYILQMFLATPKPRDFKELRERFCKSRQPDVYRSKFHIEYYNFMEQYKDYFATSEA